MLNTPNRQQLVDNLSAAALDYANRPDEDTRKALTSAMWAGFRAGMPADLVQDICDAAVVKASTGPVSIR